MEEGEPTFVRYAKNNMNKNYILIPGWTRSARTYKGLSETRPENIVSVIEHKDILSVGQPVGYFTEGLNRWVETQNIQRFNLIGHSLGGALAMEYALKFPEKVERLYLINSAGVYENEHLITTLVNVVKNIFEGKGRKLILGAKNSSNGGVRLHYHLGIYAHGADLLESASRITVPVTILWGEKDILFSVKKGYRLKNSIPGSRLVVIPNEGHDWIASSPDKFWEEVQKDGGIR